LSGAPRDRNGALALYDQACGANVAAACIQAGVMYRYAGRDDKANARSERDCTLGDHDGCSHQH
jgi:TPR repeat protein